MIKDTVILFGFFAFFLLLACNYNSNVSGLHYFLDMHDNLAVESQEEDFTTKKGKKEGSWEYGMDQHPSWSGSGSAQRVPPENTIPRHQKPYFYAKGDFALAGKELKNPHQKTKSFYKLGYEKYNTFCSPCHGYTGSGNGSVTPMLADVPSLLSPTIENWEDGEMYHIITVGRGRMLPYAAQILPEERWAIISYIRLLQKKYKAKGVKN